MVSHLFKHKVTHATHQVHLHLSSHVVSLLLIIAAVFGIVGVAKAAAYTWDGGGADNNWSTCANWSTDTCPVAGDTVTFNSTSTKNSTIDAGWGGSVTSVSITTGYTGTITASRSLTTSGTFS